MILKRNKKGIEQMTLFVSVIIALIILGLMIWVISKNISPGIKTISGCESKKSLGYYCATDCEKGDRIAPELRCSEEGKICCRGKTNK